MLAQFFSGSLRNIRKHLPGVEKGPSQTGSVVDVFYPQPVIVNKTPRGVPTVYRETRVHWHLIFIVCFFGV